MRWEALEILGRLTREKEQEIWPRPTPTEAKKAVYKDILDGFRNLQDAKDHIEGMPEDSVIFTARGQEIPFSLIKIVIDHIQRDPWYYLWEEPREDVIEEYGGRYEVPDWPKGVFIGGCVERGVGSSFRAKAHAHNRKKDPYFGWICLRSIKRAGEVKRNLITKPSQLLYHEYAHILTPDHYHDDTWRKKMKELGQPIPEQYKKKPRR